MNWHRLAKVAALSVVLAACAASTDNSSDDDGNSSGSGAGNPSTSTSGVGGGFTTSSTTSSTGSGNPTGCADGTQDIFIISKEYDLYRFDPSSLTANKVGPIACPGAGSGATPFSMSVDRTGTGWVLFNDGSLHNVSITDASCSTTAFQPNQQGFKKFGMGFVANAPGSSEETLFVANEFGVASVDTTSLTVSPIGEFGFSAAAELTGTGNGDLFAFFFGFPPYISQVDKGTAALGPEQKLSGVEVGTGFAFAFWGGAFWVFTAPDGVSSKVTRYDPMTQAIDVKVPSLGFKVVGAGVSTCAPIEEPK